MNSTGYFYPSRDRGLELDSQIRASLSGSLKWCLSNPNLPGKKNLLIKDNWFARPVDFGIYYDLVQALMLIEEQGKDVIPVEDIELLVNQLECSMNQTGSPELQRSGYPEIGTLRSPFFTDKELECMVRWLDLEPENSMGLTSLEEGELSQSGKNLARAFDALERLVPDFHAEFFAITRQVILAKPNGSQKLTFGGASSFALWGALTLNVDAHRDWWLYLPSLVHEYSHNLLFGIARNEPLVLNDPEELYHSPLRQEARPMDGIYHATFVSAREAVAMSRALQVLRSPNVPESLAEIQGYCESVQQSSTRAFWDCLGVLEKEGRLSDLGAQVMKDTRVAMLENGLELV